MSRVTSGGSREADVKRLQAQVEELQGELRHLREAVSFDEELGVGRSDDRRLPRQ